MSTLIKVSTSNLNQHSLSFTTNLSNLLLAIKTATSSKSSYLLTPELSIPGYGCEDHFLESDTETHSWEVLAKLVNSHESPMLVDVGMPIYVHGARYNCRVIFSSQKIHFIRPKTSLANDGNYREGRYFTAFKGEAFEFMLPVCYRGLVVREQESCVFGVGAIKSMDGVSVCSETCEELFTPNSPHISSSLSGIQIITNGSGSHHELRKLNQRLDLIVNATKKCGGLYLYSNQRGCDGGRLYFDGSSLIVFNGEVLAQAKQFGLDDVEVISATVDLNEVDSYRASKMSFGEQSRGREVEFVRVDENLRMASSATRHERRVSEGVPLKLSTPEEECLLGPACWMWDYLRRSNAGGFFLPLSGGADSSAVAAIVYVMCDLAFKEYEKKTNTEVNKTVERIMEGKVCTSPESLCGEILHTTYMGTSNSSQATNARSKALAERIGSYHLTANIDNMVLAVLSVFTACTGKAPNFTSQGGSVREDLALQNIQARLRMVLAYMLAQLLPWCRGKNGFLLVLGSGNVDECLRGYLTKYDCSSADLNPIGSISKVDLKSMLRFAANKHRLTVLREIVEAPPTAELRPNSGATEHSQTDEDDMGMTYEELGIFGRLRKINRCGPVSMYKKLLSRWPELSAEEVKAKVTRFFYYYSVNRHKMTTITPSYHAENYSPDDNRFDLRPFIYDVSWSWQKDALDALVENERVGFC
ncbi:hypothetical protein TrLO_g15009 [Triparma laevis f. longispina]|uniref:Glutamine-dependent NAD(+) synthetase n=1 Tax=Triparma laevis f. longispina TaxID=1714387 RepID=A0A9W7CEL2_9STRA|nr:hypothetical protein TrLO_g15009 [Triparma laevis f. longispina]